MEFCFEGLFLNIHHSVIALGVRYGSLVILGAR